MFGQLASALTALIALVLAVRLAIHWQARPQSYTLVYAVALVLTALAATLDLVFGLRGVWPPAGYALYWVAASGLVVAMGAGSAYLLQRGFGHVMVVIAALLMAWVGSLAFGLDLPPDGVPHGATVALQAPAALKPAFRLSSYLGAILLFTVAIWCWRRNRQRNNLYFVFTAVAFSAAGALGGRMQSPAAFYLLQVAGSLLLYLGVSGSLRLSATRGGRLSTGA